MRLQTVTEIFTSYTGVDADGPKPREACPRGNGQEVTMPAAIFQFH